MPQAETSPLLTQRWYPLRPHDGQIAYAQSKARFNCVSAGRRSGKSENAKRKLVKAAAKCTRHQGRFGYFAPTRDQGKRIAWQDLKDLTPEWMRMPGGISESDLSIRLINGSLMQIVGMDRPERSEGSYWDGGVVDEVADMKPEAWKISLRPALSTLGRPGWCDFVGKPKGRNHWYDLVEAARDVTNPEWAHFTWPSSEILPVEEIDQARADLDQLTFAQEYEASFVNFTGLAYYAFNREIHASTHLQYHSHLPLRLAFDFNVEPGIAAVGQEVGGETHWLAEIYIPQNSNTIMIVDTIIANWKDRHNGSVICYGDASGGARGSAKIDGSDWDLIKRQLSRVHNWAITYRYPKRNPEERARVNAVNSRLMSASGKVAMRIDPSCKHLIRDFEGVTVVEGGSGQINKTADKKLTHLSDAIGYEVVFEHPTTQKIFVNDQF